MSTVMRRGDGFTITITAVNPADPSGPCDVAVIPPPASDDGRPFGKVTATNMRWPDVGPWVRDQLAVPLRHAR